MSEAWRLREVQGSPQGWAWGVRGMWRSKGALRAWERGSGIVGGGPAGSLLQSGSSCPAAGAGAGAQRAKSIPGPQPQLGRLILVFPLSPQMAGMSPGRHLVPAEASCRAEDRLLWLLLGPEHQPQVPAGAADCGGYLGEGWSLADRQGRWFQSLPGWQQIHGATLLLSIPMAGARAFHPWPDLGVWLLLA